MYKIVSKKELTNNMFLMYIEAPRGAKFVKPGQFIWSYYKRSSICRWRCSYRSSNSNLSYGAGKKAAKAIDEYLQK